MNQTRTRCEFPVFDGTGTILNLFFQTCTRGSSRTAQHWWDPWVSAGPVNQGTRHPNNVDKIQKVCVSDLPQVGPVGQAGRGRGDKMEGIKSDPHSEENIKKGMQSIVFWFFFNC